MSLLTLWAFVACFRVNFTLPYFSKWRPSPPCSTCRHAGLIDPWRHVPSKRRYPHGVTSYQSCITLSVITWYILQTWIIFAYSSVCFCYYDKYLCSMSAHEGPVWEICHFMKLWLSISTNYVMGSARSPCILLADVPATKELRKF